MKKKKNVYFAQPWGGLGDNFVFSNLPRLYDNIGIGFNLSFLNYERNSEIKTFKVQQKKQLIPQKSKKTGKDIRPKEGKLLKVWTENL